MRVRISSLYICVKDMERAINFYECLLSQTVKKRDDIYSVFGINGFRFGLFANEKVNESHIYGDNCLPSFEIDNISLVQERLLSLNCPIEFADTEGNHIGLTSPIKQ